MALLISQKMPANISAIIYDIDRLDGRYMEKQHLK